MTTDSLNQAILERDREPFNVITYYGLKSYLDDGLSVHPHYEVVDRTSDGINIFRCRMVIESRERTCLLVETQEPEGYIQPKLLTGRADVEAHRAKYFKQ